MAAFSFKEAFDGRYDELKHKLDITSGLLTKLFDKKVLNKQQLQEINHILKTEAEKIECLLQMLEKRPDGEFETFCEALRTSNQGHIITDHLNSVNYRQPDKRTSTSAYATHKSYMSKIDQLYSASINDIDPNNGLFAHIISLGVLTYQQVQHCKMGCSTPLDRFGRVLHLLKAQPTECTEKFCDALKAIGRNDLVDKYLLTSAELDTEARHQSLSSGNPRLRVRSRKKFDVLIQILDPSDRLLNGFESIIASNQLRNVREAETSNAKCAMIVNFLNAAEADEKLFVDVLQALGAADQAHVANALAGEVPLYEAESRIIEFNHQQLAKLLAVSDNFLAELTRVGCITSEHCTSISQLPDRSAALLETIKRRSVKVYTQLINCLRRNKQDAVADVLETGGVVVEVRVVITDEGVEQQHNMLEFETKFAAQLNDIAYDLKRLLPNHEQIRKTIRDYSTAGCACEEKDPTVKELFAVVQQLLQSTNKCSSRKELMALSNLCSELLMVGTEYVCAKAGCSIDLFLSCLTREVYDNTLRLVQTDHFRDHLTAAFIEHCGITLTLRLSTNHTDISRADGYFSFIPDRRVIIFDSGSDAPEAPKQLKYLVYERPLKHKNINELRNRRDTRLRVQQYKLKEQVYSRKERKIHDLPYELLETLLIRSYCLLAKTLLKTDTSYDVVFNTLAAVCQFFHIILTIRRTGSATTQIKRLLEGFCRPHRLHPRLVTTLVNEKKMVGFMCALGDELYVNYMESISAVDVYTLSTQTLLGSVKTQFILIMDLAPCRQNDCVYVAGKVTDDLFHVDRITKDGESVEWLQNAGNIERMSVSPEGHIVLLIGTAVKGSEDANFRRWRGRVDVYNASGTRLTMLVLPLDIITPYQVVQTSNQSFIVCHSGLSAAQHRVCEVNKDGLVVTSSGGQPGTGFAQIMLSHFIALDSREQVIVTENMNRRVVLLDRKLVLKRLLLEWSPTHDEAYTQLFYDANEKRLFVAVMSGRIEVYSL